MSLGRRLISTGGAAECFTDNVNPFTGTSADGGVLLYSLDYDASDTGDTSDGTPSNVTFGVGGQINYGARFNGSSSFINTNYTLTTDTTFSFSWWMNVEAPSSGNHYIVNDGNGTVHDGSFGIYHNASGQLGVFTDDNGGGAVQGGTLSISGGCSGSWMHFVVSVNDTTATIYKNGSSEGTITVGSHTTAGVLTLIIGRLGHYSANHLNGDLDQFRYFSKAISADEVSLLYAEAACVYTATTTDNDYPTTNTAYYELNATADDSHSGTYNGTESNITYELGRYGQAAVFNGSNSVITNSSLGTALNVSAFTFSLWFKTNVNDSTDRILISSFDGSGNARFYVSIVNSGLSVVIYGSSSTYIQNFTNTVAIGNWYHLAVTHTGTTTTVYLNRSSITPSSTSGSAVAIKIASSPQPLTFGQLQGNIGTYALNGSLDQVRIFTSALTSDQITELYNEKQDYITKDAADPFGDSSNKALYQMENNANDTSGNGNNGTAPNVTFLTTNPIRGTYSASFNGSSSIISIPQPTLSGGFTLSAWFKTTSTAFQSIITMGASTHAAGLNIFTNSGNVITSFGNGSAEDYNDPASSVTVNTGDWFHVALSTSGLSSGSVVKLYINGQLDDSETSSVSINTTSYTSAFSIGGRNIGGSLSTYFNGDIDQVRVFDRELDGTEIYQLYAEGARGTGL